MSMQFYDDTITSLYKKIIFKLLWITSALPMKYRKKLLNGGVLQIIQGPVSKQMTLK